MSAERWGFDVIGMGDEVRKYIVDSGTHNAATAKACYALGLLVGLALENPRAMAPTIGIRPPIDES